MALIIGISGWKRSGKDTVADYLCETYGAKKLSFAKTLKDHVSVQYDRPREDLDDQNMKERPILHMPVNATDEYTKMVCRFMFREFRSQNGHVPTTCTFSEQSGAMYGAFANDLWAFKELGYVFHQLYWTNRALCILEGSMKRSVNPNYWVNATLYEMTKSASAMYVIADLRYKNEANALLDQFPPGKVKLIRINRFESCESTDPSERDLDDYAKFNLVIDNTKTLDDVYATIREFIATTS
jgi:hypothetical protein